MLGTSEASNATIGVPPSAIAFIDEPGAGSWRERLVVQNRSSTVTTSVQEVWLTARELVSTPAP